MFLILMSIQRTNFAEWYKITPTGNETLLSVHYLHGFNESDRSIVETVELFNVSNGRYFPVTLINGHPTKESESKRQEIGRLESALLESLRKLPDHVRRVIGV